MDMIKSCQFLVENKETSGPMFNYTPQESKLLRVNLMNHEIAMLIFYFHVVDCKAFGEWAMKSCEKKDCVGTRLET